MIAVSEAQLAALAALLHERVGFRLELEHEGALRMALFDRLGAGVAPERIDGYLEQLASDDGELRRLLPLVTIGKTSFYRDERQFAALRTLLPSLLGQARREQRPLSIWSAGCSTGEETYSLAAELAEAGAAKEEVELLGTDVNPEAVLAAREGRFPLMKTESLPAGILARHFEREAGSVRARAPLREMASFRVHNLNGDFLPRPRSGSWDVIFCRNVLIYFNSAALRRVIARMYEEMRPGGWLFLGYSESLFRVCDLFALAQVGETFLYRRPAATSEDVSIFVELPREPPPPPVRAARPRPAIPAREAPEVSLIEPESAPERAEELLREGRFDEARTFLEATIQELPEDVGLWLTLAHVYVLQRVSERATACYETAIALDPLRAEAHLFLGMHLIDQAELEQASAALTRAVFLDPRLPWGHYFLGRCHERRLDVVAARRAYRNAIGAAKREQGVSRFVSYYPDLPDDGGITVARAAELALAGL